MSNDCPKCNSQNRAGATFCDACGASLKPASGNEPGSAENGNGSQRKTNFGGLIIVVVVIGVIGYLLFGPSGNPPSTPAMGGATGQAAANPHGGADMGGGGATTPAGGGDDMEQMMAGLSDAKVKLDEDPLDIESIQTLYQTYGMIGRQEQIRPRLDAAVEALVAQAGEMDPVELSETLKGLAYAALYGNDVEAAEYALDTVSATSPDNLGIVVLRGNIYFDMGRVDEAIDAYTIYLEGVTPESEGDAYWNARTDRATMYLQAGQKDENTAMTDKALGEFLVITEEKPEFFSAWFNLGLAYTAAGDDTNAEAAWVVALPLAENEMDQYQLERELARLRGEEIPPVPESLAGNQQQQPPLEPNDGSMANPHGGMDMGGSMSTGSGMANPHGGGDSAGSGDTGGTKEGVANPHGGGDTGGTGGMANPHGG